MEYVSINEILSNQLKVNYKVPQGSVCASLFLLFYINILHNSIRFSFQFHFAGYTGLINNQNNTSVINKTLNKGRP